MAQTLTTNLSYDTTAYNTLSWFSLRPELYFDDAATVDSTPQTHKGASVSFNIVADLAIPASGLTEGTAATPVTMSDSQVVVTLAEEGQHVDTSAKVRHTGYIETDPVVANAVGFNAGATMDTRARDELVAGTNVLYAGAATSRVTVAATHNITSSLARKAFAKLKGGNVKQINGFYRAYVHPDIAYDLKSETGDVGWRQPQNYSNFEAVQNNSLGAYAGFLWIETPQAKNFVDSGVGGTVDVYATQFIGAEALAKAHTTGTHTNGLAMGAYPIVFPGPIVDPHYRQVPFAWYWFGAYKRFREAAIYRLEAASSIGTN